MRPESRAARLLVDDVLQRGKGRGDVVNVGEARITEPGARYVDFLVPGLIGMNLMGSGLWGLGFTVVIARSRKLLKRFAATPMRRSHYLLSYMLSRLLFLVLEVAAVIVFAWLAFGFTVRGSWLSLASITVLGGFTFSAFFCRFLWFLFFRCRSVEHLTASSNVVGGRMIGFRWRPAGVNVLLLIWWF